MKLCVQVCREEFVRGWGEPDDRNVILDKSRQEWNLEEILALVCVDWCSLAGPRFRFTPLAAFMMAELLMAFFVHTVAYSNMIRSGTHPDGPLAGNGSLLPLLTCAGKRVQSNPDREH